MRRVAFGDEMRRLMTERGVGLRALAKQVPCDSGYLSKVANGHRHPSADMAAKLDELLDAGGGLATLQGTPHAPVLDGGLDAELFELAARAGTSRLPDGVLDLLDGIVDRLSRDYPTVAPEVLSERGKTYLTNVLRLLDGRVSLTEHRELLVRAGWLAVLLSCTLFDAGDKVSAELVRRTARRLGEQAGHGEILAWSWEIAAWFALVERDYDDVVAYSEAGLRHAGATNAAVQLTLQAGRGYARMGDRRAVDTLKAGRAILDRLPRPDHPEHHFVFDHGKYEFYCSTIYTMLGRDDAAEEHAVEVIARCRHADGSVRWPMRYAMANLDLGLVAGRRGELDRAVRHGRAALQPARRSGDLLPRATELYGRLEQGFPRERRVAEFGEQIHAARQALPSGGGGG
ncbi:helix-turn-helix transcriptional regulator [Actinomadura sp. 7K507]|uniref:helix-turn-helix domain-containing protein n=1 Tax=Actinomadura sp. 7K507 TaxID=2530365 RepID=UPI0014042887|nr:helix-turn-helix transcriptional regulator [Actinomadura sp. 7K507]